MCIWVYAKLYQLVIFKQLLSNVWAWDTNDDLAFNLHIIFIFLIRIKLYLHLQFHLLIKYIQSARLHNVRYQWWWTLKGITPQPLLFSKLDAWKRQSTVYELWYCPEACRCSSTMNLELLVDCSDLTLRTVPRSLPINTTSLNLSRNHIEVLYNNTFSDLPRLSRLDLSSNKIATIFPEAFQGLITLKILNFRNNSLCFSEICCSIRSNVFEPLFHLEVLDIRDNFIEIQSNAIQKIRRYDYPQDMWMYLLNLKELYLEAPPDKFNDGFLKLKNLQTLSLRSNSWNSNFRHIVNDTFEGLRWSPIEKLDLGKCFIEIFEDHPFQYLPALNWLSLTYNGVRDFLSGDRRSSLVSLQHLDLSWTMLYSSMYTPVKK